MPLHSAVSTGARHADAPQITATLLQTFGDADQIATDEGLLPIHLAAMSGFTAGIRTLLSATFESIQKRELTEFMLPLDFAVDGLSEEHSSSIADNAEESSNQDVLMKEVSSHDLNKNHKSSVELLLSSMFYNRLISAPRQAGSDHPFLPLHGAAVSCPTVDSWRTILSLYGHDHALDLDSNGCTVAHMLCSQDRDAMLQQIEVLEMVKQETFFMVDKQGFLPLHRALTNKNVSLDFIEAVLRKHSAIADEVQLNNQNQFAKLLPVQLAACHNCDLDVIFELYKTTAGVLLS